MSVIIISSEIKRTYMRESLRQKKPDNKFREKENSVKCQKRSENTGAWPLIYMHKIGRAHV